MLEGGSHFNHYLGGGVTSYTYVAVAGRKRALA